MSTTLPVPVSDAAKVVISMGLQKMEGVGNQPCEIWVAKDLTPEMIPYAGKPLGQYFDGESLQEIYKRYG